MGIYGEFSKKLVQMCPIAITFKDSMNNETELLEADVILISKNNKEVKLLIRDSHAATMGGNIPKGNKKLTMNHAASVKLKTPKEIVGVEGVPLEIHDNKVSFDEKTYKSLKKVSKDIKDTSKAFVQNNLEVLNDIWDKQDAFNDFNNWKKIIDKNYKDIKKITGVSKEIQNYLDSKKGADNNGKNNE